MKYAALACATALVLAGCSKVDGTAARGGRHVWTHAGVLRVAVTEEPRSLNPLLPTNSVDGFIDRLLFAGLLSADARGNPVPMLAERTPTQSNGGISRDGLTITYRLRRGGRPAGGYSAPSRERLW